MLDYYQIVLPDFNNEPTMPGHLVRKLQDLFFHDGLVSRKVLLAGVANCFKRCTEAAITAGTTQTQAGGFKLTKDYNQVTVVANANDTVVLRAASSTGGDFHFIENSGANTLRIYPESGDDLGQGVDTFTTLAPNSTTIFRAVDATTWMAAASSPGGEMVFDNFGSAFTTASVAAAGGTLQVNITASNIPDIGLKGIMMARFKITPSTDVDSYDAEFFRTDGFVAADQQLHLQGIDTSASAATAFIQLGPFFIIDEDQTNELHLLLTNDDPANAATFNIEIEFTQLR